jgi:hypothetical protein
MEQLIVSLPLTAQQTGLSLRHENLQAHIWAETAERADSFFVVVVAGLKSHDAHCAVLTAGVQLMATVGA